MSSSILLQIKYVKDKNKLKDLAYLINQHKDAVEDYDTNFGEKQRKEKIDFTPWVILENDGNGLYLAKKIIEKFEPWVTMYIMNIVYKNNIPKEIQELKQWNQETKKKYSKVKLQSI